MILYTEAVLLAKFDAVLELKDTDPNDFRSMIMHAKAYDNKPLMSWCYTHLKTFN